MRQGSEIRDQGTARRLVAVAAVVWLGLSPFGSAWSQQIQMGSDNPLQQTAKKQHVSLVTDAVELNAGAPQDVEVRFRVDSGFHINSHTPKDELLIATALKLDEAAGFKVLKAEYPAGSSFHLGGAGEAGETLDVYQGEFRVRLRVVAPRGASTLSGTLRYQACDNAACFPPRTLPVKIAVTAK